uniref:Uncharacterized protein n=1 Tax=Sphaerodactylus townsendi TaxID=933632 RepID=A0ACB8F3R0_9SAUR
MAGGWSSENSEAATFGFQVPPPPWPAVAWTWRCGLWICRLPARSQSEEEGGRAPGQSAGQTQGHIPSSEKESFQSYFLVTPTA